MKKFTYILIVLLLSQILYAEKGEDEFLNKSELVKSKDEDLSMQISTQKKIYKAKEQILIKIEIKNLTKHSIKLDPIIYTFPGCGGGIKIKYDNTFLLYIGPSADLYAPEREIKANSSIIEYVTLNVVDWKNFDQKGMYSISYTYSNYAQKQQGQWFGKITANLTIKKD